MVKIEKILRYSTEGLDMDKPIMNYFKEEDILHLVISEEKEAGSVELTPNITVELNEKGELIGIEIVEASSFIRDSILEAPQAKMLNLSKVFNKRMEPNSKAGGFHQCYA